MERRAVDAVGIISDPLMMTGVRPVYGDQRLCTEMWLVNVGDIVEHMVAGADKNPKGTGSASCQVGVGKGLNVKGKSGASESAGTRGSHSALDWF